MSVYPRDNSYFSCYNSLAERALEIANFLQTSLDSHPSPERDMKAKIYEKEADDIVAIITEKLEGASDPPFDDREDNFDLAIKLDDIVDEIEKTYNRINCFKIETDETIRNSVRIIIASIHKIRSGLSHLKHLRKKRNRHELSRLINEIGSLEEEADDLHRDARRNLAKELRTSAKNNLEHYRAVTSKIKVIDRLESISDACEGVAHCLERIKKRN